MTCPQSRLTYERPDIWNRALALATNLTGYSYPPKMPLPDGGLSACGGGYIYESPADKIERYERQIGKLEKEISDLPENAHPEHKEWRNREIARQRAFMEEMKKRNPVGFNAFVPEGAMEWLLHEVGHWVAATPEERLLADYGYGLIKEKGWGRAREWQAWGFEEIILSPFGVTRLMTAPEHRGGVAFSRSGAIPDFATAHANKQIDQLGIVVGSWRELYGEWLMWERFRDDRLGHA